MPIYCFKCDDCSYSFEEFFHRPIGPQALYGPTLCPMCGSKYLSRDYMEEKPIMMDDIEPYFDMSIGQHIKGRRDKATKYRQGGYTMIAGHHGGDITSPEKQFYGDEEYHEKFLKGAPEQDWQKKLDDMVHKGIEEPEGGDVIEHTKDII